jgi:hypothetical protein
MDYFAPIFTKSLKKPLDAQFLAALIAASHGAPVHHFDAKIEALAAELVHRNQNLLAVVAATARRMVSTSASLAEFERGFIARLQSISRSFDLIVHGTSPYDHSAYFASLWQVETVRSAGQVSLIATGAISVVAAGLAIAIWRAKGPEPSRTPGVASEV